jgi:hypothetical protein
MSNAEAIDAKEWLDAAMEADSGSNDETFQLQVAQVHATLALAEELRRLIQVIRERP